MKKVIAAAMARSKREIPHYYLSNEIDLKKALAWLEQYNSDHPVTERILYIALLIKSVVHAIKEFPNSMVSISITNTKPGWLSVAQKQIAKYFRRTRDCSSHGPSNWKITLLFGEQNCTAYSSPNG